MTPKEKAFNLVDSFYQTLPQWANYPDAEKCATIAVDEILAMGIMSNSGDWEMAKEYWNEVKIEIENLKN